MELPKPTLLNQEVKPLEVGYKLFGEFLILKVDLSKYKTIPKVKVFINNKRRVLKDGDMVILDKNYATSLAKNKPYLFTIELPMLNGIEVCS